MSVFALRGFLIAAILLVALAQGAGWNAAAKSAAPNVKSWLDKAVLEKHCPLSPVNVPAALLQDGGTLQHIPATRTANTPGA